MEHLMSWLASPVLSAYSFVSASGAVCKINGEVVPCEKLWESFKWFAEIGIGLVAVFFIVGILFFILWLLMLIHAIKNPIEHKPVWVLVLLLTGILGAIVYYFAVKRAKPTVPSVTPVLPLV